MSTTLIETVNNDTTGEALPATGLSSITPKLPLATQERQAWADYLKTETLQREIRTQYGYIGAYLVSQPELGPILVLAALQRWGQAMLDGALMKTQWWKTTTDAQRNWQYLTTTNPGTAANQIAQQREKLRTYAESLGVTIPAATLTKMATTSLEYNWTTATIQQIIRTTFAKPTTRPEVGSSASFANQARALAGEYGIYLSTAELAQLVKRNQAGTLTASGLEATFTKRAQIAYPWMKTALEQGVTPSQYLSTYADAAATTLGIDSSSVLWTTPKWMRALMTQPTGKTAETPVNVGVFQQNLMRTAAFHYSRTQGARDQAVAFATAILNEFGKVKT